MTINWRDGATGRTESATGTSCTLTVPADVQAGDLLVLGYVADSQPTNPGGQAIPNDPTGVTGWTAFDAGQSLQYAVAKVWWKVADASDAGATVTVGYSGDTSLDRQALTLGVWSGGDNANPLVVISAASVDGTVTNTHVMPTVDTTGDGSTLIGSIFLGREQNASASYSVSGGWTLRESNLDTAGSSGGRPSCAIIDSGTEVAAGSGQGGGTVTGDQNTVASFAWTFAIAPATAVQTARPVADVTTANWTPSSDPGGAAMCSLLADGSDSTYVTSIEAPASQVWEAKLPVMSAPPDTVTNRIYFAGGATSGTVVTDLVQGTTVIATRTDNWASAPPTTPTDLTITLTGAEQAAITNLADLRIRCTVTAA